MPSRTKAEREKHYRDYQSRPDIMRDRAKMNSARRKMIKAGKVEVGDGKDVHHKVPLSHGGETTLDNLQVTSRAKNRGYPRDGNNKPTKRGKL